MAEANPSKCVHKAGVLLVEGMSCIHGSPDAAAPLVAPLLFLRRAHARARVCVCVCVCVCRELRADEEFVKVH